MKNALIVCITHLLDWLSQSYISLNPKAAWRAASWICQSKGKPASEWNKNAQYQKDLMFSSGPLYI